MTGGGGLTSTRHAVMHVRPARGGRGLYERGSQPLSAGITRRQSAGSTRAGVHGRLHTEPQAARQRHHTAGALASGHSNSK